MNGYFYAYIQSTTDLATDTEVNPVLTILFPRNVGIDTSNAPYYGIPVPPVTVDMDAAAVKAYLTGELHNFWAMMRPFCDDKVEVITSSDLDFYWEFGVPEEVDLRGAFDEAVEEFRQTLNNAA